jgi:hypothetical protein
MKLASDIERMLLEGTVVDQRRLHGLRSYYRILKMYGRGCGTDCVDCD